MKIHKPIQPWTKQIHHFLNFMNSHEVDFIPKPLGFNDRDNEILTYVAGETCDYPLTDAVKSQQALISSAKLLRKYHDLSEAYITSDTPSLDDWMFPARAPIEVVCHNDFAPYNICFQNTDAIGIIDFETAAPGPRVWDVAYALYRFAPFTHPDNTDGFGHLDEQCQRAKLFCDAYGLEQKHRINLVDTVIERLEALTSFLVKAAQDGDAKYQRHISDGHHIGYDADRNYIKQNIVYIRSVL